MEITLVVPTYNEAENLPILMEKVFKEFSQNNISGRVIVVDDDSPDGTWRVAEELRETYPGLDVLRRIGKSGLSSAVLDGFETASSEVLGVMDADLSHPPERIPAMLEPILSEGADFVIGSRYVDTGGIENWTAWRKLSSKLATLTVLGLTNVKDPMSGYFFIRRKVVEGADLDPKGFKIALEILVRGNYRRVVEVPIVFADRRYGKSKLGFNVVMDYLLHLSKLYAYKLLKQ